MGKVIRLLSSVKFAVSILILIILSCLYGAIMPQGLESCDYLEKYGSWGAILFKLGLADIYHSPWFIGLLGALWLSLLACAKSRLKSWKKQAGSFLTHISLLAILLGALINMLFGESGFISLPKGDDQAIFLTGNLGYRFKRLDLRARLDELSLNGIIQEEQNKGPACPIGQRQPPEPEGRISFFNNNGRIIASKSIKINRPFSFKGYTFYLENYEGRYLNWVELKVTNDPGIPLVYAGFIFLNLGAIIIVISKRKK